MAFHLLLLKWLWLAGREPDSHLAHWFKLSLEWLKDRKIYI